jgi:hypothetical protein
MARENMVIALFRRFDSNASEITAGPMAPKLASPNPTITRQKIMNENPWAIPVKQVPKLQPIIPIAISFFRDKRSPKYPKIGEVRKYPNMNAVAILPMSPSFLMFNSALMGSKTAESTYRSKKLNKLITVSSSNIRFAPGIVLPVFVGISDAFIVTNITKLVVLPVIHKIFTYISH